jgi:hypothetical protein
MRDVGNELAAVCVNSATEWASPATECETVTALVYNTDAFLTTLMTDNTAWIITIVVSPIPICKHITTFAFTPLCRE